MGIITPFAPRGSVFRENSFYRAPGAKWAQETSAGCLQQRYATGEPGKVQGRDRVWIVEGSFKYRARGRTRQSSATDRDGIVGRSCVYLARGVSIRGKFVLSRNPEYKTSGVDMWLNIVLTPGQSSGTGPIGASCGYCCLLCPTGNQYSGKIRFIEPQGDLCRVPAALVRHGRARQSSETGPYGDCRRVLWVPGPRGQYSGTIHFIQKPGVQD